ncbi:MAG TPA: type II toxin-antitoxin system PemK/MazF family toxin [Fimbriimonadaceae bacterium]|nr:type II toxin-antitoxin system PemK/MazF family toxin [Fimbriimonadaceae bacterium]
MRRGEIRYADAGGTFGRRPVLIVTASEIIPVLTAVTCAPITTSVRAIPTRVALGPDEGLRELSEAVCDSLVTLPKSDIDTARTGFLDEDRINELDRAIARALDIRRANLPPA